MSTIKKQSLYGTLFSYAGVVIGFFSQGILIPNILTKDQNGLLGIILSFVFIFAQVASLGFNSAGSRFFPYFNNTKGYRGFLFTGVLLSLLGFLLGSFIYYFLKPILIESSSNKSNLFEEYYWLVLPVTLGTILFNLFDNYAKNLYSTVEGTFLNQFFQRFIIFIGLLLLWVFQFNFNTFIWIWASAFIIPTLLMVYSAYRLGNFSLKPDFSVFNNELRRSFINYSAITVLTGFSSMIIMYIDKIMLNHYLGLEETGIYNTASFFGSIMGMSMIAMNKAAVPVIVNAFKEEDYNTIHTVYKKSCMIQLIIGGLVYGGILINLDSFFELVPQGYEAGKYVIVLICFGKLFDLATGLNGTILTLSKYYKYDTLMIIGLILITVILNMIFIPKFGLIGAAFAAMISIFYFNSMRTFLVWLKLKMQPFNLKSLLVCLVAFICIVIFYFLPHYNMSILITISDVIIRSILFTSLYVLIIYKFNLSSELNDIINSIILKVKSLL
jgi:O-antigen/teichoic acid export membrane protein